MGAGIAGAHVRRGVPVLMLDSMPAALEKGVAAITKVDAGPHRDRPHDAARRWSPPWAGSAPTTDADADGRPRRGHRGGRRERGGQGARSTSELQTAPAGRRRSWRRTPRRSRSRAWPRRWPEPENFAGMHFFNPVDRMQLVEVIRGEKTSDDDRGDAGRPGQADRQDADRRPRLPRLPGQPHPVPVHERVAGAAGGGRRPADHRQGGDDVRHADGADHAATTWSAWTRRCTPAGWSTRPSPTGPSTTRILDELVAAGRLGQKSGAGFYSYAKGSQRRRRPGLRRDPGEVPQGPAKHRARRRSPTGCSCRC